MADRRTQMSAQEAIIAQKKAEIEAKKLSSGQPQMTTSSTPSSTSSQDNKKTSGQKFVLTNRFGLKGKPKSSEFNSASSSTISTSPASIDAKSSLLNTFNNDGSFLERFKKLEQKKPVVKVEAEVKPEIPKGVIQATPIAVEKPPEADDWYKEALERARKAAQNVKQGVHLKSEVKQEPIPIVNSSEYGPSLNEPSTSKSGVKLEIDISQMTPVLNCQDLEPLPIVVQELASMVALSGDQLEDIARARNVAEEQLAFLQDTSCEMYRRYRMSVESMRKGMTAERDRNKEECMKEKKRKSRWGEEKSEPMVIPQVAPQINLPPGVNPQLVQYAMRVFGSTDLTDDQWRQCEDQQKMSVVYNEMLKKKSQLEMLEQQGKRKYEYDSDEDTEGGTWEHKARRLEMEKTLLESNKLTEAGKGKHHIGDFLPPEELTKFMAKFQALQRGEDFDESDYQDNKLTQDNLGFKMLQRMGWSEGSGLGTEAQGIVAPIGKGSANSDKKGLGTTVPHDLGREDNEYDAYRKRMMLAYRFRPNPLNNPRRAYY